MSDEINIGAITEALNDKADDSSVVHNIGTETVEGAKSFKSDNTKIVSLSIDLSTTPSSDKYSGITIQDKNGKRVGKLEQYQLTNGDVRLGLNVCGYNSEGTIKYSGVLGVGIKPDGTSSYTMAPTPATNSNDTNIATTAWFNNKMKVVSALPSSPSADVFYFVTE